MVDCSVQLYGHWLEPGLLFPIKPFRSFTPLIIYPPGLNASAVGDSYKGRLRQAPQNTAVEIGSGFSPAPAPTPPRSPHPQGPEQPEDGRTDGRTCC